MVNIRSDEARILAAELIRAADEADDHCMPQAAGLDLGITVHPSIAALQANRAQYTFEGLINETKKSTQEEGTTNSISPESAC